MALFIDTFVNKVDGKGRVSVPASFRAALNGQSFHGIVALPLFKYRAVLCGGIDFMERLSAEVNQVALFSDEQDDLAHNLFADSKQLPFDGEGRIVLPEVLARHAGIDGLVAFVGRGPTFEIWEPQAFEAHKTAARQRAREKGLTLRLRPEGSS